MLSSCCAHEQKVSAKDLETFLISAINIQKKNMHLLLITKIVKIFLFLWLNENLIRWNRGWKVWGSRDSHATGRAKLLPLCILISYRCRHRQARCRVSARIRKVHVCWLQDALRPKRKCSDQRARHGSAFSSHEAPVWHKAWYACHVDATINEAIVRLCEQLCALMYIWRTAHKQT